MTIKNILNRYFGALLTAFLVFGLASPALAVDRVHWSFTDEVYKAHPSYLDVLDNGNLLVVRNGYSSPAVLEIDKDKKIVWKYDNIQANSAVRLENGNTLITDSGAPGYPFVPAVKEVNEDKEIVWQYKFKTRADVPRYAERLKNGNTLIVTPNKIMEVSKNNNEVWSYSKGLINPVKATRLNNGNTVIVDKGFKKGKVIEVNSSKQIVWKYDKALRPIDVVKNYKETIIVDFSGNKIIYLNKEDKITKIIRWEDVLSNRKVMNQWSLALAPDNFYYLSVSLNSGSPQILKIDDRSFKIYLDNNWFDMNYYNNYGNIYVPAREFLTRFGVKMYWNEETKQLSIYGHKGETIVTLNNVGYKENGEYKTLPLCPIKRGNTLMLPLRVATDLCNLNLDWNNKTQTISISSKKEDSSSKIMNEEKQLENIDEEQVEEEDIEDQDLGE